MSNPAKDLTTWTTIAWMETQAIRNEARTGTNVAFAARPLTDLEHAAGTRFGDLDKITTNATARLTPLIEDLYLVATTALVADALANLQGDDDTIDVAALVALLLLLLGDRPAKVTEAEEDAARRIEKELDDVFAAGASTYYDDLDHQGVPVTSYDTPDTPTALLALAAAAAAHPFTRIVQRLITEYQSPKNTVRGTVPVDEITAFIADTPQAGSVDQLNQATQTALAEGRAAAAEQAQEVVVCWVASEVMDNSSCSSCKQIDETVFWTWEEARAAYPTGTYKNCAGGQRCRGQLVPLTETIAPDKDAAP